MKSVSYNKGVLELKFNGNDFTPSIAFIKSKLKGWNFDVSTKLWTIPALKENVIALKADNWVFMNDVEAILGKDKELPKIDESLFPELYPFQKIAVRWLEQHNGYGLIGDVMGLGKSCEALSYFKLHKDIRPVVVVCPASVKLNWQREIIKWLGEESFILYGYKAFTVPDVPFYIVNYDIIAEQVDSKLGGKEFLATSWLYALLKMRIKGLIIDECQMLSSGTTKRTKSVLYLKRSPALKSLIALSGTPIRNRPAEFFTILHMIAPKLFPNRYRFNFRYCAPYHNGYGWKFTGASNIDELYELVSTLMIRRTKEDIALELPEKRRIIVPMELDELQSKNYKDANEEFLEWLRQHLKDGIEAQTQLEKLKQLAYIAKRNSVVQWIEDYLTSGNKLVVGTFHKKTLHDLMSVFKKVAVFIDGSVSAQDRQKAVDTFQNQEWCRLILCQIQTAPGLTLTAASATATVEFAWTSADHEQFEFRVDRVNQKAKSVEAYYLVAEGTVEMEIMELIQKKYNIINKLVDGKEKVNFFGGEDDDFVKSMIKQYRMKAGRSK